MAGKPGRSGRKPQPKVVKELKGTFRMDRHNPDTPDVKVYETPPRPPQHMKDDEQKKCWRRTARLLTTMRVLTEADLHALEAYCATYSRWRYAESQLEKYGVVLVSGPANERTFKASPYISIAEAALKNMRTWMNEFGITPASRSRVSAEKPAPTEEAEDFFHDRRN